MAGFDSNSLNSAKDLDIWLSKCDIDYDKFVSEIEDRNNVYFDIKGKMSA